MIHIPRRFWLIAVLVVTGLVGAGVRFGSPLGGQAVPGPAGPAEAPDIVCGDKFCDATEWCTCKADCGTDAAMEALMCPKACPAGVEDGDGNGAVAACRVDCKADAEARCDKVCLSYPCGVPPGVYANRGECVNHKTEACVTGCVCNCRGFGAGAAVAPVPDGDEPPLGGAGNAALACFNTCFSGVTDQCVTGSVSERSDCCRAACILDVCAVEDEGTDGGGATPPGTGVGGSVSGGDGGDTAGGDGTTMPTPTPTPTTGGDSTETNDGTGDGGDGTGGSPSSPGGTTTGDGSSSAGECTISCMLGEPIVCNGMCTCPCGGIPSCSPPLTSQCVTNAVTGEVECVQSCGFGPAQCTTSADCIPPQSSSSSAPCDTAEDCGASSCGACAMTGGQCQRTCTVPTCVSNRCSVLTAPRPCQAAACAASSSAGPSSVASSSSSRTASSSRTSVRSSPASSLPPASSAGPGCPGPEPECAVCIRQGYACIREIRTKQPFCIMPSDMDFAVSTGNYAPCNCEGGCASSRSSSRSSVASSVPSSSRFSSSSRSSSRSVSVPSSSSIAPTCGNGIVEPGEQCDKGTLNGQLLGSCQVVECWNDCSLPTCGNGRMDGPRASHCSPTERCDDGNDVNDDDCDNRCLENFCGDGIVQAGRGEQCDGPPSCHSGLACSCTQDPTFFQKIFGFISYPSTIPEGCCEDGSLCTWRGTPVCTSQCRLRSSVSLASSSSRSATSSATSSSGPAPSTSSRRSSSASATPTVPPVIVPPTVHSSVGVPSSRRSSSVRTSSTQLSSPASSSRSSSSRSSSPGSSSLSSSLKSSSSTTVSAGSSVVPSVGSSSSRRSSSRSSRPSFVPGAVPPDVWNGNPPQFVPGNGLSVPFLPCGVAFPCGICGNGAVERGEACDDGNVADGDACSRECRRTDGQDCTSPAECESRVCRAGRCVSCAEDGDCPAAHRCIAGSCALSPPFCGNGRADDGEHCDDGNANDHDACRNTCLRADGEPCRHDFQCASGLCVNGICSRCQSDDQCPTGFACISGACVGASAIAYVPNFCGNGIEEPGESCDDGVRNSGNPNARCRLDCSRGRCGDGISDRPIEECDDGNLVPGDGCNVLCQVEHGSHGLDVIAFLPGLDDGMPGTGARPTGGAIVRDSNHGPVGDTGPAALAVVVAGAAAGVAWIRRRKR